ncbi:MAG: hypothetical protein ACFFC7_27670 [Candidatus Hermodarchaeota archaeon]
MSSISDRIKEIFRIMSENRFVILFGAGITILSCLIYLLLDLLTNQNNSILFIIFGVVLSIVILLLWWKLTPKLTIPMSVFLTTSFIGKILFSGGTFIYFEKKDPEAKEYIPLYSVISRFTVLLIAWLSLSFFIIGVVGLLINVPDPRTFAGIMAFDLLDLYYLGNFVAFLLLLCLVPIILGIFVPTAWSLADLHLKAWDQKSKINWYISQKFLNRFSAVLGAGGITGAILKIIRTDPTYILNIPFLLIDMILIIILPLGIIVTVYGVFLTEKVLDPLKELLDFSYGETTVDLDEKLKTTPSITVESKSIEDDDTDELEPD